MVPSPLNRARRSRSILLSCGTGARGAGDSIPAAASVWEATGQEVKAKASMIDPAADDDKAKSTWPFSAFGWCRPTSLWLKICLACAELPGCITCTMRASRTSLGLLAYEGSSCSSDRAADRSDHLEGVSGQGRG